MQISVDDYSIIFSDAVSTFVKLELLQFPV